VETKGRLAGFCGKLALSLGKIVGCSE
jgi:hypothetical protein